jgi:hypothetical protein
MQQFKIAEFAELKSQMNVCDPSKVIPQLATALYLIETKKGGQAFKKTLQNLSPHAYYKIYLEPLFNALIAAGVHVKDNDDEGYEFNYLNSRFYNIMMKRAGYMDKTGYYDNVGPRLCQKAVLLALQKLMKNDLSFNESFMFPENQLIINKETGDVEIAHVVRKKWFDKIITEIKKNGGNTEDIEDTYNKIYSETPTL